jgi:hypothetical protein
MKNNLIHNEIFILFELNILLKFNGSKNKVGKIES